MKIMRILCVYIVSIALGFRPRENNITLPTQDCPDKKAVGVVCWKPDKERCLSKGPEEHEIGRIFLDFDGTVEEHDALAHFLVQKLKEIGLYNKTAVSAEDYTDKALSVCSKLKKNAACFVGSYFGHIESLNKFLTDFGDDKEIYILSSAWDRIPAKSWAKWLECIIQAIQEGLPGKTEGFSKIRGIFGLADPDWGLHDGTPAPKGAVITEYGHEAWQWTYDKNQDGLALMKTHSPLTETYDYCWERQDSKNQKWEIAEQEMVSFENFKRDQELANGMDPVFKTMEELLKTANSNTQNQKSTTFISVMQQIQIMMSQIVNHKKLEENDYNEAVKKHNERIVEALNVYYHHLAIVRDEKEVKWGGSGETPVFYQPMKNYTSKLAQAKTGISVHVDNSPKYVVSAHDAGHVGVHAAPIGPTTITQLVNIDNGEQAQTACCYCGLPAGNLQKDENIFEPCRKKCGWK